MSKLETVPLIWTPAVRNAWRLPEQITVSQWADRNRVLDHLTSAEAGQWRTDRTPYLRGIMDSFSNPLIEIITIEASTQIGKTESWLNMFGYVIDQDPGPTLIVKPIELEAKDISKTRVLPMLQKSRALSSHLTSESDDLIRLQMKHHA